MLNYTGNSVGKNCEKSKTNFGYVFVHKKDRLAAIREGGAAASKAKSEFGLSDVKFGIVDEDCGKYRWDEPDENNIIVYPWDFRDANALQTPPPEIQVCATK
jgi:hypothetical protein